MKKWSKLVLAAMLSVGTLLVSGCIENIEPSGIADLRGAKAELLRAQVALQTAQAAKLEADAALVLAQAKVQEALAKQEEARVKFVEAQALAEQYKAEYQALVNEAYAQEQEDAHQKRVLELENLIAEQEAAMAAAENAAVLAAEEFKIDMLEVAQRLAEAQLAYDQALLDIEVAKKTLTADQQEYLAAKVDAVLTLKREVEGLTEDLEAAADALAEAAAELDEPKANKVAIKRRERAVVTANAAWEAAKEAEAEALALLELDPMVTDWAAQLEKLEEDQKALEKERDAKAVAAADRAKVRRDSIDVLDEAAYEYEGYTGYTFNEETGYFSKVRGYVASYIDIPEVVVKAPLDSDGNPLFGADFVLSNETYEYGAEADVVKRFEAELAKVNAYTTYTVPYEESLLAADKELAAEMLEDEDYIAALEKYDDMVKAYNEGDYLAYAKKYVFTEDASFWTVDNPYAEDAFETAVADYNTAVTAFNAAVKKYSDLVGSATVDELKLDQIAADKDAAIAKAELAKVDAMQKAQNDINKAEKTWIDAKWANKEAEADRDAAIAAALATAEVASETELNDFIATYNAEIASDEETAKYNKYIGALADINEAKTKYDDGDETTLTDPASVYAEAKKVWDKAMESYRAAIDKAGADYDAAEAAAETAAEKAEQQYLATVPDVDAAYENYYQNEVQTAYLDLTEAIAWLSNFASTFVADPSMVADIEIVIEAVNVDNADVEITVTVPEFLADEEQTTLLSTTVKDIVALTDAEAFLEDIEDVYPFRTDIEMILPADYPLTYPTYEAYVEYCDAMDEIDQPVEPGTGYVTVYYDKLRAIAKDEAKLEVKADPEAIEAYAVAIEAAQAEVEAFMTEKAAEIDALKADVEANYPRLLAELEDVEAETDAFDAKVEAFDETRTALELLISKYCDGYTDVEEFVAGLEAAYETAVQATLDAEQDVLDAEQELQDLQEGLVTAVELAQKAFDKATENLENAQKLLDFAVEELDEAIALIYGEEETPAA